MSYERMLMPGLAAVGALVVLAALGVNVATLVVLLALLACPLMMLFMMRGMGHGGTGHGRDDGASPGHDRQDPADRMP